MKRKLVTGLLCGSKKILQTKFIALKPWVSLQRQYMEGNNFTLEDVPSAPKIDALAF